MSTNVCLYEIIDCLYWMANRSQDAVSEWNTDIFNYLARINEEDYE